MRGPRILFAQSINADMIRLDEKSVRRGAADRGLRIVGTLGVLGEAAAGGLTAAIDKLPHVAEAAPDHLGNR